MMSTTVRLCAGPLDPVAASPQPPGGAVVQFLGVVRPDEAGRPIVALNYEAYEPMTSQEMLRLAQHVAQEFGVQAIHGEHSVGRVPVGAISFRLTVAAGHRAAALEACSAFIDQMKRGVPLWKVPVWTRESAAESATSDLIEGNR